MITTPNTSNTPIDLLNVLAEFATEHTSNLLLQKRPESRKEEQEVFIPPSVYKMDLPKKEDEERRIPYILIQILTGKDEQKPGELPDSTCSVRFVVAVYSDDMGEGKLNVLNVLTRLRMGLLQRKALGGAFLLSDSIEWVVDPMPPVPYFFGEMIMTFEMPPIYPMGITYGEEEIEWQRE